MQPSLPILAITERSAGHTRHKLVQSRDMDLIESEIEKVHFFEDGAPDVLRADSEFNNKSIREMLKRHSIEFKETPARRHSKVGQVERSHGIFKFTITANKSGSGHTRSIAYEDIRLVPMSPFLKEIMELDLLCYPYGASPDEDEQQSTPQVTKNLHPTLMASNQDCEPVLWLQSLLTISELSSNPDGSEEQPKKDIGGAYFQEDPLDRDVYMLPPELWKDSRGIAYKLLKPAYGLVESGKLWQLKIEKWLLINDFKKISGFTQLFALF
eukprot:IDg3781t1